MSDTGKIGVAKVAISSREYLAAVKPDGLFLILELMHSAHEVLEPESLTSAGDREVAPMELEMAKKLIDAMTTEWEPAKYKDRYQTAVMEMIENKAAQRAPSAKPETARAPSNVVDLVAVLQQSLQKAGTRTKSRTPARSGGARSTAALMKKKRARRRSRLRRVPRSSGLFFRGVIFRSLEQSRAGRRSRPASIGGAAMARETHLLLPSSQTITLPAP